MPSTVLVGAWMWPRHSLDKTTKPFLFCFVLKKPYKVTAVRTNREISSVVSGRWDLLAHMLATAGMGRRSPDQAAWLSSCRPSHLCFVSAGADDDGALFRHMLETPSWTQVGLSHHGCTQDTASVLDEGTQSSQVCAICSTHSWAPVRNQSHGCVF